VNIIVKKDNQTFGPHSREEILEFIKSGELTEDDLASPEGDEDWDTLGTLLSLEENQKDPSIFDQFEDDEVDYEKLKEWEDVFVDEDEDEDENEDDFSTQNTSSSVSETIPVEDFQSSSVDVPETITPPLPPPFEQESIVAEELINPVSPPTNDETVSGQTEEYIPPPSPSLPLPPPPQVPPPREQKAKEKSISRSGKNRISGSHTIKGLNRKQTVIVVKGEGILSKIYSTSLLFIILFIVVAILGFVGLIFAPDKVSPILINIGVPSDFIQSITSPKEGS
jgi:hypothetical protein